MGRRDLLHYKKLHPDIDGRPPNTIIVDLISITPLYFIYHIPLFHYSSPVVRLTATLRYHGFTDVARSLYVSSAPVQQGLTYAWAGFPTWYVMIDNESNK